FRSVAGTELLVVFIGVAGGGVAALLPRIVRLLPLVGVLAFSIAPIIKPFIGPIPSGMLQDEWDGNICLQSTPSTCGAASIATILRQLGDDAKESDIAADAHSYAGGTEAWYLARVARARGFEVRFAFTDGFTPEEGLPAVIGVTIGSVGHFVPVLGREGELFIVGDPLRGRELLSLEELDALYGFTGFHMQISAQP
ncbi:MAG: cysteine peptidase family C39 domain-containing protein, partial [Verrucomicrobiota bacterium]